jgi:hypothetical protein
MFHTVKPHTNFYKIIAVFSLSTFIFVNAVAADKATPLQLKQMQTRQFSKSPEELADAIKASGEDLGGQCHVFAPTGNQKAMPSQCYFQMDQQDSSAGAGAAAAMLLGPLGGLVSAAISVKSMADVGKAMKSVGLIKYDISVPKEGTGTIVRMRMYNHQQKQIDIPLLYQAEFKKIADSLFIEALEIDPAKME